MLSKIWKKAGENMTSLLEKVKSKAKYNSEEVREKNNICREDEGGEQYGHKSSIFEAFPCIQSVEF